MNKLIEFLHDIVALRNEKGSYNYNKLFYPPFYIVALRNEKGSYNWLVNKCKP